MLNAQALRRSESVGPLLAATVLAGVTLAVTSPTRAILVACLTLFAFCSLSDLRARRIPNAFTYSGLVLVLVASLVLERGRPVDAVIGAALGLGIMVVLHFISRGSLGLGDAKLAAFGGALVGGPYVLPALFVGSVAALVPVATLLVARKLKRKQTIPFGPFLAIGFVAVALIVGTTLGGA